MPCESGAIGHKEGPCRQTLDGLADRGPSCRIDGGTAEHVGDHSGLDREETAGHILAASAHRDVGNRTACHGAERGRDPWSSRQGSVARRQATRMVEVLQGVEEPSEDAADRIEHHVEARRGPRRIESSSPSRGSSWHNRFLRRGCNRLPARRGFAQKVPPTSRLRCNQRSCTKRVQASTGSEWVSVGSLTMGAVVRRRE